MANVIACNLNSYLSYRATAYGHLARIGLTNVEIPCPEPKDADAAQAEKRIEKSLKYLRAHGLME